MSCSRFLSSRGAGLASRCRVLPQLLGLLPAPPARHLSSAAAPSSQSPAPSTGKDFFVGNGRMTMDAAVLREANKPLVIETLQMPRPKAGEVLLRTKACGACHTDLHVMKGEVAFPTPSVLGHEVTGEILEHGAGTDSTTVKRLPVGSKVVAAFIMPCGGCFYCVKGQEDLCETFFDMNRLRGTLYDGTTRLFRADNGSPLAMYSMGGLAEYCVVPASAVALLPPQLPFAESAVLGCAMFTAFGAMRNAADLRAGESVAVIGVGGIGSSCLQVARAFGAKRVIAVDVAPEKLALAEALGATHTLNALSDDVTGEIKRITGGRGVDVAVEALGKAATFTQALASVRDGGRAVIVGVAPAGVTAAVEITRLVRREIRIIGSYGARTRQDLPAVISLAEDGHLDVAASVTQRFPLAEAQAAFEALDRGDIRGRAIIQMH